MKALLEDGDTDRFTDEMSLSLLLLPISNFRKQIPGQEFPPAFAAGFSAPTPHTHSFSDLSEFLTHTHTHTVVGRQLQLCVMQKCY